MKRGHRKMFVFILFFHFGAALSSRKRSKPSQANINVINSFIETRVRWCHTHTPVCGRQCNNCVAFVAFVIDINEKLNFDRDEMRKKNWIVNPQQHQGNVFTAYRLDSVILQFLIYHLTHHCVHSALTVMHAFGEFVHIQCLRHGKLWIFIEKC